MNPAALLTCVPLFGLLAWAAVVDLRERRIPNWLTLGLLLSGLAQTWAPVPGPAGSFSQSLLGLLTGFGITFVLFGMGALGGGDVKLVAGVGAWLGPTPVLTVFAAAAVIGMVIVLTQAAMQGRTRRLLRNSAVVAISLAHANEIGLDRALETGQSCASVDRPLPYAVPVLLAVALVFWMNLAG